MNYYDLIAYLFLGMTFLLAWIVILLDKPKKLNFVEIRFKE